MLIENETSEKGVTESRFSLEVEGEHVPGILWRPADAAGPRPVILIGHGGTQHKRAPNVLGLARRFVRHLGYAAVAIDAPGHGDRVTDQAAADAARRDLERRIADRQPSATPPMARTPEQAAAWAERITKGRREWKALVDDLEAERDLADGRIGYWGVSMGTAIGLPFVADEPRVQAAVLGLAGLSAWTGAGFAESAAALAIPVLFLFQWDDELMTRESGIALFDAIGSQEKTMHVNPGGHVETPLFERDAAEQFFVRHLGTAKPGA